MMIQKIQGSELTCQVAHSYFAQFIVLHTTYYYLLLFVCAHNTNYLLMETEGKMLEITRRTKLNMMKMTEF